MTLSMTRRYALRDEDGDPALARRAAGGDTAAFESIMRRHNRTLYRAARGILRDDAEAEEAVQEGYIQAYRSLASFRGDAALATWLTRIVINKALERLRRRKRDDAIIDSGNVIDFDKRLALHGDELASDDTPERALAREQTRKLLERRIDELPSALRTVFILRALEEMSVEDCAACLGIPQATVRTRFFRARRLLRQSLACDIAVAAGGAFAFAGERCDRIVAAVMERIASPPQDT